MRVLMSANDVSCLGVVNKILYVLLHHTNLLVSLPLLWRINFLQKLRILISQLELRVLHRFLDPLLTAKSNDRYDALLDSPCRSNARHAHIVLLCNLLDPLDDLLVDLVFASVYEALEELIGLCALGGAVAPGSGKGASGNR
jgi:hypothetical protein